MPASIYEWGLDHGARNDTDTMALVIGPAQDVAPSKPNKTGRDQFMQMVDWLIAEGKTSVKDSAGLGEMITVYSKKFAAGGTFEDNAGNNAFSLTPSSIYTEEWHIWIMASSRVNSGTNPWNSYGSNAEGSAGSAGGSGNTAVDLSKYYLYTVPAGQTQTLFGFVSVGCKNSTGTANKTFGNFLDNVKFRIYHPLSGSTTTHGSGVVAKSDGTVGSGGAVDGGYEVTVDHNLITYATDGEPLEVQAVLASDGAGGVNGCEFVGLYYTKQGTDGSLQSVFLERKDNEIDYREGLTDAEKSGKWIKSTGDNGDIIYTYYLDNLTSATDLHFIFIKSPTVTYDPNGGKEYIVERTYNTSEANNVYSFKPNTSPFKFISPYVSHAAVGQNDGWKFMGWLLTGDTVSAADIPVGTDQINEDQLGSLLLPAVHTIACDYDTVDEEQYFKIMRGNVSFTENKNDVVSVKWVTGGTAETLYANVHKGLTMVAQWRWRQAFIPQVKSGNSYIDSTQGGTVEVTSVTGEDSNYNAAYTSKGGISYHAETDEIVTVKAIPKDGFGFEGWYDENGNLLTTKETYSYTETKESVRTCYARFLGSVTQTFIRKVRIGDTWTDTSDNSVATLDRYTYSDAVGTPISSTVTVGTNYTFLGWFDASGNMVADNMLINDGKTLSYTTTKNARYYAYFVESGANMSVTTEYIRQVKEGGIWQDTTDDSIAVLDYYSHDVDMGTNVSSTATAGTGYEFVGWYDESGNRVTGSVTLSHTATGNTKYYARFKIPDPVVYVTQTYIRQIKDGDIWKDTEDDSIATLDCYSHYDTVGNTSSSTATAGTGYEFVGWYDEAGNKVSGDMLTGECATLSYTTTGDATYYARFSPITVTQTYIRQIKDGDGWRELTDDCIAILDCYTYTDVVGTNASSTATAKEGYIFAGWYDKDGNKVSDDMLTGGGITLSYTIAEDATYYARFEKSDSAPDSTEDGTETENETEKDKGSSSSGSTTNTVTGSGSTKTGDDSMAGLYAGLLVICAFCMAILILKRKKVL